MSDRPRFRLTERFEHAVGYANRIHSNQTRKGTGIPYLTHLLGVASLVMENGAESEDEVIGALLHDAAEDQGGRPRLEDIQARFGEVVRDIVDACTDSYDDPKPPWRERKEAYVIHVRERVERGGDEPALRVSLADKLHNTRAILADVRESGRRRVRTLQRQARRDALVLRGVGGRLPWLPQPDGRRTRTSGRRTPPPGRSLVIPTL